MNHNKTYHNRQIFRKTFIAFSLFILLCIGCLFLWKQLYQQKKENGTYKILRKGLHVNEMLFYSLQGSEKLAPTYQKSDAVPFVRTNGKIGLNNGDTADWHLKVIRKKSDTISITIADLKKLPKTSFAFNFKCIEGWSQISHWGGVKFSDFVKAFHLEEEAQLQFCGLETSDGGYYVGIDNKSMLHPQTLLAYELNDKPLPVNNGAPLRLIIPIKYGVKHLKQIGTIFFSNYRPRDYWFERGYDYYCGL